MANSAFEYVRQFETWDALPPSNWIVVRIDGRGFSKLCKKYCFAKPNDIRALGLMNAAAVQVLTQFQDVVLAYGQSDEYSFVFQENTSMFERRAAKLATSVATAFTAEYCLLWPEHMVNGEGKVAQLERPWPTFDGRCVCYPKRKILKDYLAWRQADCHINNLYNTTFWNMVLKGGQSQTEAELELKGTVAADKNEILFSRFGINYNNEPEVFRKGSVVYRSYEDDVEGSNVRGAGATSKTQIEKEKKRRRKAKITVEHVDLIGDAFWEQRPYVLLAKGGEEVDE